MNQTLTCLIINQDLLASEKLASDKYKERFCIPRVQGVGGSIGIWECISHKGIGFQNIYTERIYQYNFKETLENKLLPTAKSFFGRRKNCIF